jgi:hypothetical protein
MGILENVGARGRAGLSGASLSRAHADRILIIFTTETNEIVVSILIRSSFGAALYDAIEKGQRARVGFVRTFDIAHMGGVLEHMQLRIRDFRHEHMFLDCNRNRAVALQIGTMALVPQIADAVSVPVICIGAGATAPTFPSP